MNNPYILEDEVDDEGIETKIPWHFWAAVGLFGIYIAYRIIQIGYRLAVNFF